MEGAAGAGRGPGGAARAGGRSGVAAGAAGVGKLELGAAWELEGPLIFGGQGTSRRKLIFLKIIFGGQGPSRRKLFNFRRPTSGPPKIT